MELKLNARNDETKCESYETDYASVTNLFEEGCYFLGDFENFSQCTQLGMSDMFGKLSQNTDKRFLTHGRQSLRIEVYGYQQAYGQTRPSLIVFCEKSYFQKTDFTDCDLISFDLYHTQKCEANVDFLALSQNKVYRKQFKLKHKWNEIGLSLKEMADSGNFSAESVTYFAFIFERGEKFGETQIFYLDNFKARKKRADEREASV